ncbi:MFS transporter [Sporanaerobium hydrogeniformans]|uniref:MFS transporter n=1 Tax=Sporanaerobium hydrogeniformans TaxID=3072179 RepID=A0AC61DI02_9FIRM|nr:MFS transporter [Sporanaerobium hydrogeniformans]PHV72231.1 MFS transporter [Sporanaerobium hydrogeniformans]
MRLTKQEKSWVMYDFANSVYATIMMAAIFPIYFSSVCQAQGESGDFWWGIGTAIATFTMALLAPVIGAIADYKGYKKKLFNSFLGVGLIFTLVTAFTGSWRLMLLGYTVSHIGFSGSCLVYDSFLTDVTDAKRMDHVSSLGYGLGYIGGSTIPFLMSILLISAGEKIGITMPMAIRLSVVLTVCWWGLFSIPFLKNVKQEHAIDGHNALQLREIFKAIGQTLKNIFENKRLFVFLLAYFFYIDGVNTVINMATSYGATLGLDSVKMILALLVTQLVAFPCAILFGKLSGRWGALKLIKGAVMVYLFICVLGFWMGFGLEEGFLSIGEAEGLFWFMAAVVGTVQGGIQAISRSYFGKLIPPEKSGEYFGFFDVFGKFAAVIGPALYAGIKGVTGRSSLSILSITLLFVISLMILLVGRRYLEDTSVKV